jgi:predicted PurR-regulated permease PerM
MLLAFAWFTRGTLLLLFLGMLLALVMDAAASFAQRRVRLPRAIALLLVIAITLGTFGVAVWLRGDSIAEQIAALQKALPQALGALAARLDTTLWGRWLVTNLSLGAGTAASVMSLFAKATGMISGALGGFVGLAFVVFVAVCFSLEPRLYFEGALRLLPVNRRARVKGVLEEVAGSLRSWLVARLISMVALGTLVTVGLTLLHIPLAGPLGTLAGLLAFIPNIGALAAALPAILLAFAVDPRQALIVAVMYWLAHAVDDFLVIPLAERTVVHLPPALTVTAQLILAALGGLLGIMLAAPLTASAIVIVRRLWVEDVLERDAAIPKAG